MNKTWPIVLTRHQGVGSIENAWRTGNKAALFEDFTTRDKKGKDPNLNVETPLSADEDDSTRPKSTAEAADDPQGGTHDHAAEPSNRSGSDQAASRPIESPVQVAQSKHREGERYPQRPIRVFSPLSSSISPPTRIILTFESSWPGHFFWIACSHRLLASKKRQ